MSWPLACFALVAAVLVIGWLAYERSRPSARTVALVATLSALAALGRDAFAALDDVKPITAMTFVVGYALGPLPGFVVGAIGMLASNIVLGQGSWTPWQMAAWGLVGLLGALAGRLSRRRLRRLPLALGCALAALVAKEIMNLYEWSIGAIHTPAALLVEVLKGMPFDIVDVVSTLLFGLAFGPELARMLARTRARTQVQWQPAGTALMMALALLAGAAAIDAPPARAAGSGAASVDSALARGVAYLISVQKPDGGFGEQAGSPSAGLYTGWTAVGLAAAGRQPLSIQKDGHTVLDAIQAQAGRLEGLGGTERTILALHACGLPAGVLGGHDLAAQLAGYREGNGSFAAEANHTAFGILAMRALGDPRSDPAIRAAARWLAAQQNADGGFSFGVRGDPADVDDTAAAIQGIVDSGVPASGAISRALSYLARAENRDGGFPQQPGGESNAQSTAWAIQGLIAAGHPPGSSGRSPISYLKHLAAANGSVHYAGGVVQAPVWVTAEALVALAERPFPIAAPSVTGRPAAAHAASTIAARCTEALDGLLEG
jgi:energy-coupling factor transport system substrate-specific component